MSNQLAQELRVAVALLKGYAAYDHQIRHFDDEALCRKKIAHMEQVLAEFEAEREFIT